MEKNKLIKTIKAAQNDDKSAISLLYSEYAKSVYRLAFKLTGSKEEAEDIMQNVFIIVLNKINEIRKPEAFESWLNRITANYCTATLRKGIQAVDFCEDILKKQEETEVSFLPEHALNAKETARIISEAVDALPLPQKMCIYYHYYQGLTAVKIAEVIGENIHTVKSRIALAKKKIRTEITRIEKEQGVKLHGIAFITPALKLSVETVEVPKTIIESVWGEIAAASVKGAVKIAASDAVSTAAAGAGIKLAALLGGVFVAVGIGVGLYFGTDLFREVTPIPIIETIQTDESEDDSIINSPGLTVTSEEIVERFNEIFAGDFVKYRSFLYGANSTAHNENGNLVIIGQDDSNNSPGFYRIRQDYSIEEIRIACEEYFANPILERHYYYIIDNYFREENGELYFIMEHYMQQDNNKYHTNTINIFNREENKIEFTMDFLSSYHYMEQLICTFVYEDEKWKVSNTGVFSKNTNEFSYYY